MVDIAELNIEDFRGIFIQTDLGEMSITKVEGGIRVSFTEGEFLMKIRGENAFELIKEEK